MKKFIAVVLALSMVFAVCACGKSSSREKASDALTAEEENLLEAYRKADTDTRQNAVDLLEGKSAETGDALSNTTNNEISLVGTWELDPEQDDTLTIFAGNHRIDSEYRGKIEFYNDGTFRMSRVDGILSYDGTYSIIHDGSAIEFWVKGKGDTPTYTLRFYGTYFTLKDESGTRSATYVLLSPGR